MFVIPLSGMKRIKTDRKSKVILNYDEAKRSRLLFGALGESRTHNPLLRREVLYPLSYERIDVYFT